MFVHCGYILFNVITSESGLLLAMFSPAKFRVVMVETLQTYDVLDDGKYASKGVLHTLIHDGTLIELARVY